MLQRALRAEAFKLKHSPIWLAFIIIPVISAIMGTINYVANREILTQQWYSLWTQHTIFYCYFCFPALVAIYCSYICRLEHMNNNWKSVLAQPINRSTVYMAKWITVIKIMLLTQVLVGIIFVISGKLVGFTAPLPKELVSWLFYGTIAGSVIAALQLAISLVIKSFSIPIGIALMGGVIGLGVRAAGVGLCFPYSLFAIGMNANSPESGLECSGFIFSIICAIFILCFAFIGIRKMKEI